MLCNDRRSLKAKLLLEAAEKDPHVFYQFDGFSQTEGDCVFHPDRDGDSLFASTTPELRHGGLAVRIQVLAGTPQKEAIRLVTKLLKWMRKTGDWKELESKATSIADPPQVEIPF